MKRSKGVPPTEKDKKASAEYGVMVTHVDAILKMLSDAGCVVGNGATCEANSDAEHTDKPPKHGTWTKYIHKKCGTNCATNITLDSYKQKFKTDHGHDPNACMHGHHIVMKGTQNTVVGRLNTEAQDILVKHDIDPYIDCENLAYSRNWSHGETYARAVRDALVRENLKGEDADIPKVLRKLAKGHDKGRYRDQ